MTRTERRVRLLWLTLACATLAAALAGCGNGGAGSTPPPPPPPAPPESAYLLAEFVASDSNHQSVRVWDPAQPGVAIQSVPLVMRNGIVWTSSHLVFSDATTYDAATRSVTTLGHAKVFFDNDGLLYSIDLRGGQSHVPVPLSSAVDVFLPASATAMDAAGDDAWVDAQGGSHHWAIRASMSAADAPISIEQLVAPMRDATTGLPAYFFVALGARSSTHTVPTTYEVVDATFAVQGVAAVTGMVSTDDWVGADPAQPGLGYLRISNQLLELHWGAGAVSVDATSLHTFGGFAGPPAVADAQAVYFNDGGTLYSLTDGVVHAIGTFSVVPTLMLDAGGYIAGLEGTGLASTQVLNQVETLQKSSGALTLIESPSTTLQLLAASDQGLVLAGTPEQGQAFVLASGDNQSRTTIGAQHVGVVRAASGRVDQPAAPVAMLSCVAGTGGFCAPGALTETGLSGAGTVLGTLTASAPWVRGDATVGLVTSLSGQSLLSSPAGFGDDETDGRDAWQLTPASAGSLTRVTSNLP
jgi:hypothetical protein